LACPCCAADACTDTKTGIAIANTRVERVITPPLRRNPHFTRKGCTETG
jgi:hypothetical protein